MKSGPYSLLVDGSNDTALKKLNLLTVKLYDASCRQVATRLLDMCTTTGRDCGTATTIFNKIDLVLSIYTAFLGQTVLVLEWTIPVLMWA